MLLLYEDLNCPFCYALTTALHEAGLEDHVQWRGIEHVSDAPVPWAKPGVALADTGVTLGDSWETLHAAYPETETHWAEGAAVGVGGAPWPTIFDGVDGWRMSGYVDYEHPERTPDDSVVTRLSAGEGPEPGCC